MGIPEVYISLLHYLTGHNDRVDVPRLRPTEGDYGAYFRCSFIRHEKPLSFGRWSIVWAKKEGRTNRLLSYEALNAVGITSR